MIKRNLHDPTRHQTTFKTAWNKMVAAADLGGLQMYDLRRTAITNLLCNPQVSDETVIKIAGHVDRRMLKRYSYKRLDTMRDALECLGAENMRSTGQLTSKDILEMLSSGFSPDIVVATIKKARKCTFDTSIDAMRSLRAASVPDAVILAMVKAG